MTPPLLVYYSSTSENTKRFVESLPFPSIRIPIDSSKVIEVDRPYVLVMPTYGGGQNKMKGAVPKQVRQFLNNRDNRRNCVGIIGNGNTSFGESFVLGPRIVAEKIHVPVIYSFEVFGTEEDVTRVTDGLNSTWARLVEARFGLGAQAIS